MSVAVGNFDYFGMPFPLVLGDRYFHLFKTSFGFNVDIFRWDYKSKRQTYEVINGQPIPENITWNPNAAVIFKQITPKLYIYKLQAKPGVAEIAGKVPLNKEFAAKIDENEIGVIVDNNVIVTLRRNQVEGPIGLAAALDGSFILGVSKLPDGMVLKRGYLTRR